MCGRNWWLIGFIIGNLAGFFYWDATIWLVLFIGKSSSHLFGIHRPGYNSEPVVAEISQFRVRFSIPLCSGVHDVSKSAFPLVYPFCSFLR